MSWKTALTLSAAALLSLPAIAEAQDRDWHGQITPYVWAAGLGGDATPFTGAPTLSVDKSLSEVLEDTDGAMFLTGYARRDRLVFMGDLSLSSSSKEGVVPPGLPARAKLRQRSMTLLAGYRAIDTPDMHLDVLGGARLWKVEAQVDLLGGAISRSGDKSFADPLVALRANYRLSPRWSAIFYADYGGFGVGSEQTSQLVATANYQVTDNVYLSAGYRQLNVDYRDGGTRIDMTMAGPLVGVSLRF